MATTRTPGTWPRPPRRRRWPPTKTAPLAIQGEQGAADAHAGEGQLEPGVGLVLEARGVQPDPALGVLAAPVVADGRAPADDVDERAVEDHLPARDAVRDGRLELGLGERQAVERGGAQVAQRDARTGHRELPLGHPPARPGLAAEALEARAHADREVGDRTA